MYYSKITSKQGELIDEIFGNFGNLSSSNFNLIDKFPINYEINNENNEIIINVAIPGYSKDELKIEFVKDTLEISAEIDKPKNKFNKSFSQEIKINESIDDDNIKASLNNGILKLVLIKKNKKKKIIFS